MGKIKHILLDQNVPESELHTFINDMTIKAGALRVPRECSHFISYIYRETELKSFEFFGYILQII